MNHHNLELCSARLKENALSRQGASQMLRRVAAALLFIAAAIEIGSDPPLSGALAVAGGVIYGVWPKPETKTGDLALRHGQRCSARICWGFR